MPSSKLPLSIFRGAAFLHEKVTKKGDEGTRKNLGATKLDCLFHLCEEKEEGRHPLDAVPLKTLRFKAYLLRKERFAHVADVDVALRIGDFYVVLVERVVDGFFHAAGHDKLLLHKYPIG